MEKKKRIKGSLMMAPPFFRYRKQSWRHETGRYFEDINSSKSEVVK